MKNAWVGRDDEETLRRYQRAQRLRENKEKLRRLNKMFLSFKPLDSLVASEMRKYGLRPSGGEVSFADPEVLMLFSEAAKLRLSQVIRELIQINRANNAMSFVHKKLMPRDIIEVQAFNCREEVNKQ